MAVSDFNYPEDYACRFAINKMWANPQLNQQFQLKMSRISPPQGELDNFVYMGRYRLTPDSEKLYQIFSLGGYHPGFWGLFGESIKQDPNDRWINIADITNYKGLQLDIYNSKGYQYPKNIAWIMFCYDKVTLVAIEVDRRYETTKNMYLRCYSTDLDIPRGKPAVDNVEAYQSVNGGFNGDASLVSLYESFQKWNAGPGITNVYVNGFLYPSFPSPSQLRIGDDIYIAHDPIVHQIETYNLSNLENYYSDTDKKRKYIIHPPRAPGDWSYRYYDDTDFYLVDENGFGLYFHRNNADAVRQLTHRDYGVAVDYVDYLADQHPKLKTAKLAGKLFFKVVYRQTKWKFNLQAEASRLHYLYHLDDSKIIGAMAGVNSTVPEWQATSLETCNTNKLLRARYVDINLEMVRDALGYNGATMAMSKAVHRISFDNNSGARTYPTAIEVPPSYQKSSTAYEYDDKGVLIGFYPIKNSTLFKARFENCAMVEFLEGEGGDKLHYTLSRLPVDVSTVKRSYQVYFANFSIDTNKPSGDWEVAVEGKNYNLVDGKIVWEFGGQAKVGLVLFNDYFVSTTLTMDNIDRNLEVTLSFDVAQKTDIGNIKLAQVDLFLNGYSLTENVDYINDYPLFHIFNKQFIKEGAQTVVMRAYGLIDQKLAPKNESELGFVVGGVIGHNSRYNLRDDRVTRSIIAGRLFPTEEIPSLEVVDGDQAWDELNGMPYSVRHQYIPNLYIKKNDDYYGYGLAREVDFRICNYMTRYGVKKEVTVPDTITDKYRLYSPLLNAVSMALVNRIIVIGDPLNGGYSQQYVADKIRDYLSWFNFDPVKLNLNPRYVTIQPHNSVTPLTVNVNQFIFLKAVGRYYFNDNIPLEGFYEVNNNV